MNTDHAKTLDGEEVIIAPAHDLSTVRIPLRPHQDAARWQGTDGHAWRADIFDREETGPYLRIRRNGLDYCELDPSTDVLRLMANGLTQYRALNLEDDSLELVSGAFVRLYGTIDNGARLEFCTTPEQLEAIARRLTEEKIRRATGRDWRRRKTSDLEALLDMLDEDHDLYDEILEEVNDRAAAANDSRVAQMMGAPTGEGPS